MKQKKAQAAREFYDSNGFPEWDPEYIPEITEGLIEVHAGDAVFERDGMLLDIRWHLEFDTFPRLKEAAHRWRVTEWTVRKLYHELGLAKEPSRGETYNW